MVLLGVVAVLWRQRFMGSQFEVKRN